jgi:autotransporter translocation and assembly factor TamB
MTGAANEREEPAGARAKTPGRRRRWRRRFLALGALLVLLLGGLLVFRNAIARMLLPRLLGPALGLEITVDDVAVSLDGEVVVRGLASRAPADWTQFRELRFRELRGRISIADLVARGIEGVKRVSLTGGVLDLDLDRPGPPAAEPPPEDVESKPFAWPARLPRIDVELESLQLRSGDDHARIDSLHLDAHEQGDRSAVRLRANADWKLGERAGKGPLALSLSYRAGVISGLAVTAGESEVIQNGELALADLGGKLELRFREGRGEATVAGLLSGTAKAEVSFTALPLGELLEAALREPSPARGTLALKIEAELPLETPLEGRGTVSLSLTDARFESRPLPAVSLEATVEKRALRVPRLRIAGEGVDLHWEKLRGSLESLDPEEILRSASGVLVLESRDLSAALVKLLDDPALLELARGASLSGRVRVDGKTATVELLELLSPLCELVLTDGRVDFDLDSFAASRFSVDGSLRVDGVDRFASVLGEEMRRLRGRLVASFAGSGTFSEPAATVDLEADGIEADGVPLGSLALAAAVSTSAVDLQRLELTAPGPSPLSLSLAGKLEIEELTLDDASLALAGSDLRGRARTLGAAANWLPAGSFDFAATARGPLSWPDVQVRGRAAGWRCPPGAAPLDLTASKRGHAVALAVRSVRLLEETEATLELDGEVEEGFAAGELRLKKAVLFCEGQGWETPGEATIRFDLSGPAVTVDPPLVLSSDAGRVLFGASEAESGGGLALRLEARFPRDLPLAKSLAPAGTPGASDVDLTVEARYAHRKIEGGAGLLPASLGLRLRVGSLPLPPDALAGRAGGIRAALDFGPGDGELPEAMLSLEVSELLVEALPGGSPLAPPLTGRVRLEARWDGREIRLATLEGNIAGVELTGGGSARFDARLADLAAGKQISTPRDIDVRAHIEAADISLARRFASGLRRCQGRLILDASLRGSPGNLSPGGVAVLEGGDFRLGDAPALTGVRARAVLAGDTVRLESLSGELGGAPLEITGSASRIFDAPRLDLAVRGTNILLVRTNSARLRADAALAVSGEVAALKVAGKVAITDGRILQRVPLVEFLGVLTRRVGDLATLRATSGTGEATGQKAAGLKLFSLRDPPLKDLRFEVRVASEEAIELRGNVFRGRMRPDVTLLGSGEVPYLSGSIYVDDLALSLPAARVLVESGSLRFDETNPLFPEISMKGSTRLRGYDITVTISGRIHEPTVEFSSSPPLPADQLMLLVTTGKDPEREGFQSDQAALITVAKYFGIDLLTKLFGSDDLDAAESILDRFEFDAGRNVSRSGSETWEARFRLTRKLVSDDDTLYLTGERDEFDHYNAGLRIVFRGR